MPSQQAIDAMEFWKSGNYEGLYNLASSQVKSELPRDFFISQNNEKEFPILLAYRITKTEQKNETAEVIVSVSIPDFPKLPNEISAAIISGNISDKQIREIITKGATTEKILIMEMLKEPDGWRINKFSPLDYAADIYRKKMAAQSYAKTVEILSLTASETDPSLGDNLVKIEGKIENKGKELLSKVELTVRFRDKEGQVIHEAKIYPILISGCTSADVAKHMQNAGDFSTYIRMTEKWTGRVEGEVTDIELGDEHIGCGG